MTNVASKSANIIMTIVNITPVAVAYSAYQDKISGQFKPDQRFYNKVGINRKRFGQIMRGEKPLFGYEVLALSDFFGVPVTDLL